jgi:hypothetical protein
LFECKAAIHKTRAEVRALPLIKDSDVENEVDDSIDHSKWTLKEAEAKFTVAMRQYDEHIAKLTKDDTILPPT